MAAPSTRPAPRRGQPVLIRQRPGSQSAAVLGHPRCPPYAVDHDRDRRGGRRSGRCVATAPRTLPQATNGNYVHVPWITLRRPQVRHRRDSRLLRHRRCFARADCPGLRHRPKPWRRRGHADVHRGVPRASDARRDRAAVPPHADQGADVPGQSPATRNRTAARTRRARHVRLRAAQPGGSFEDLFAAATCRVRDTATGTTETVGVPAAVTPASGGTSTVFTVTCASLRAPAGYAYRVLIERPGSARYTLLTTTSQPATTFLPYQGTGTYRFECQVQTPEGVTAASPPAAVSVALRRPALPPGQPLTAFLLRKAPLKRTFRISRKGETFPGTLS